MGKLAGKSLLFQPFQRLLYLGILPAIEVHRDGSLAPRFIDSSAGSQNLSEKPVRLEPVRRCNNGSAKALFGVREVIAGSVKSGKVVPGVLRVLGGQNCPLSSFESLLCPAHAH